jgi:galactokinase
MQAIRKRFEESFNKTPLLVASPGRVNLIGEHTDYNQGFVLPAAVDKKMYVAIAKNGTRTVNAIAAEYDETFSFELDAIKAEKSSGWTSYLLGVAYYLQDMGCEISGVDVVIDGDVPVGAGMSSSAALCCAFGFALNELFTLGINRMQLVYIGQKTEHVFAGVKVGVMDQFASLHGKAGHVMKLDCRSMQFEYIPFNFPDHKIVMVNSMVKHSLADSEYNVRRHQCEEGVKIINQHEHAENKSLRDITLEVLESNKEHLPEVVYKRCLYIISENARLLQGCDLIEKGDLKGFGKLMYQTHQGLSKLYEVSCEELDFLAENAYTFKGVTGTRMMGGGFGGCTINLVEENAVEKFTEFIKEKYRKQFQTETEVYITQIEDGTKIIA